MIITQRNKARTITPKHGIALDKLAGKAEPITPEMKKIKTTTIEAGIDRGLPTFKVTKEKTEEISEV